MELTLFDKLGNCKNPKRPHQRAVRSSARPHYHFRFDDQWQFSRQILPAIMGVEDCQGVPVTGSLVAIAEQAHRPLQRLEADFVWLALAVYFADRFAPRYPYGINGPNFWRRRISLEIPVSDPDVWKNASQALVHALEFLTEDDWGFDFVPRRAWFEAESQEHFRQLRDPAIEWTSLFSGGLDSLAGALLWLQRTNGVGLLVSGQTHNRMAVGQAEQVEELRFHFPNRIEHVGLEYGFTDKHGLSGFESTQRTRAFIHTALGSLVAMISGCPNLFLFENGFGALNLPCDSAQIGSQNSRGTHPVFLRRMAAFVSAAFSKPFSIVNPFGGSTKSQMLSAPGMDRFTDLFQQSFSCDRYPNYKHSAPQCGHCASCLIRRLSFRTAGLPDDGWSYSNDVFRPRTALRQSEVLALTKLTTQAESLAASLRSTAPWRALTSAWPELARTELELNAPDFRDATTALLRRHIEEWRSFVEEINPVLLAFTA